MISLSYFSFAADYVRQVIIINEGYYDYNSGQQLVPVTAAVYHPSDKTYTVFDTIEGQRFASDVIVDDDYIYVAADKLLLKYDKYTLQKVAAQDITGIRNIAAWNDKLLVTRGEVGGLSSYFQVYNQADLSFDYELDINNGPAYATQNIEVIGDKAYFVINNGFDFPNYTGYIGVVDLITKTYLQEINLGPNGLNPDNLMREGDKLYTLNNKDYTGSSVSVFDITTGGVTTTDLPNVSTGCGTSTLFASNVWYQQFGSLKLHQFNPESFSVVDSADFGKNFYGLAVDPVNNYLYATVTDYVSSGMAYIYDVSHMLLDSFVVGVSPGNIAFDIMKTTGIEGTHESHAVMLFPNPVTDELKINLDDFNAETATVMDMAGRQITSVLLNGAKQSSIPVSQLSEGLFVVIFTGYDGSKQVMKFLKQ